MATIISGKEVAAELRQQIKIEVQNLKNRGITPTLAVILVGDDPASKVYVRNKSNACNEVGIAYEEYTLPAETPENQLIDLVQTLNQSPHVHGILIQSPLPAGLDFKKVLEILSPEKDVDAFHPYNVGKIMIGDYEFLPCTPAGVMELIHKTGVEVTGKNCVVIGRSNIVGKPQAMLLLKENGTVTICHSKTKNLKEITRQADILIVAIGKGEFVTGDMVKPGAVVIDVGMNRNAEGKLVGDVNFAQVEPVAGYITPVPGGVGPMTITMLLKNTVKAAELSEKKCNGSLKL